MSKKKKILTAAIVILAIGAAAFAMKTNSRKKQLAKNFDAAFTTETAMIERQTLSDSISATGTVASAETKTVNTSLKDLEVVAVYVKEGDYVEEGTVICEFDASDYEEALAEAQHNASINAQIEALDDANSSNESVDNAFDNLKKTSESRDDAAESYDDAKEDYSDAKKSLSKASSALNSAKAKYDAIADELGATPAALKNYQNDYEAALETLAKYQVTLSEAEAAAKKDPSDSAAQAAVKAAKANVESQENEVKKAKSAYDIAATRYNELLEIKSAYEKAQESYNAAKSELSSTEAAVDQAESKLDQTEEQLDSAWESYDKAVEKADQQEAKEALQDQLITESQEEKAIDQYTELIENCVVTASMSGVITSLNVTEGNIFEGGDVYTIQDNENFLVTCSVDEYDISSIEKGMPAYIKTDATGDTEMTGEVTYVAIAPSGNGAMGAVSSSASYTVKVSIDNADPNIRAGMTAKLSIALEESEDTLTVPYDAVTTRPDGTASITVDDNGEKKEIIVETGLETDYYTEILSDEISEGMTVYLTTPMVTSTPENSDTENPFEGFGGGMPGGNGGGMPSGGGNRNGGGMPSGGGPSGGPGGF